MDNLSLNLNVFTLLKIGCVKIIFTFSLMLFTCFISAIVYLWHYIMVNEMNLAGLFLVYCFDVSEFFFFAQIEVDHENFLFYSWLDCCIMTFVCVSTFFSRHCKPTFISHNFISKTVRYHNLYTVTIAHTFMCLSCRGSEWLMVALRGAHEKIVIFVTQESNLVHIIILIL